MMLLRRISMLLGRRSPVADLPPRDPNLVSSRVSATTAVLKHNTLLRAELAALEQRLRRESGGKGVRHGVAR